MSNDPPVDFQQIAQGPPGATNADYPYSIKATDLMKNFVFATLYMEDGVYEETTGMQGHLQRKLKIQPGTAQNQLMRWDGTQWAPLSIPSGNGPFVLAMVGGGLVWLDTEECT